MASHATIVTLHSSMALDVTNVPLGAFRVMHAPAWQTAIAHAVAGSAQSNAVAQGSDPPARVLSPVLVAHPTAAPKSAASATLRTSETT